MSDNSSHVRTMQFGGLRIAYDADVLEPRAWTVAQSRWAADLLADAPDGPLLELCTGVGNIGLAAIAGTDRRLVAVDVEPAALRYARANADEAGLGDRIDLRQGELDEALQADETFHVAVADPPWVPSDETGDHPDDPGLAIDGGDDGLDIARLCLRVLETHLAPGGVAIIQLGGTDQADSLREWAADRGVLTVGEVRTFERGVLARIDRPGSQEGAAG